MPALSAGAQAAPFIGELVVPLARLIATMTVSLVLAQLLETFGWTRHIARLAAPVARFARLSPLSGAAFSLSFVSPAAANAMLAEGAATGGISRKELFLANILNSGPTFFVHLPTLCATAYSFLGAHALTYVGLVFAAASLRTAAAAAVGRFLPHGAGGAAAPETPSSRAKTLRAVAARLKKRLSKICMFTIPVYCLVFVLQQAGAFTHFESFLAARASGLFFLHPGTLGVVALHVVADGNAAFAAAAALMNGGTITPDQAILALLVGNILSSPMRAFRHQLPSYAGYFSPSSALALVGLSQSVRAVALALVAMGFYIVVSSR